MPTYSLNEIVELAVQIERNGYEFYNEASKRKDIDEEALALLVLLRDQELHHEKIFLHLREDKDMMIIDKSPDWELVGFYMKSIVNSRLFTSPDSAIKLASESSNFQELLKYAITFEKDTLLFFYTINDNLMNGQAQAVLRKIINEEIKHVLILTEYQSKN